MMNTVFSHMTMSLDGYIADTHDGSDELFDWYNAGEVEVPAGDGRRSFKVDAGSAAMLRGLLAGTGALVCGRRLFDLTNGWDDHHPVGAPVVVVTHRPPQDTSAWPRTTFVADVAAGIAAAREIAGGRDVTVASASIAAQALDLGLLDEVRISLVPVLLGTGIPYFAELARSPHRFDDPTIVAGSRATHLTYAVRRD
jgi:dihydrofolate reductase